jgi:hypothetical protein
MTMRYQGAPSRSGRSSTITRCYSGAWSGAQAPSATRWPAASPASDRSRSCAITWTMRSCPCRGGGTLPLPGGGHADPWQRAGPCAHPRAPQAGVPGRTASAWRRRRRGGHHRGVDRCPVRRARDEGERPAASLPHRRGRGPWGPARRHAHAADRRARVMPLHLEEESTSCIRAQRCQPGSLPSWRWSSSRPWQHGSVWCCSPPGIPAQGRRLRTPGPRRGDRRDGDAASFR